MEGLTRRIGHYYCRARFCAAQLGRFCSRDPVGYRAGNNGYLYVGCRVAVDTDPSGTISTADTEDCCCCCVESNRISSIKKMVWGDAESDVYTFGHEFVQSAQMIQWPTEGGAKCRLEFWECANEAMTYGGTVDPAVPPGSWFPAHTHPLAGGSALADWERYYRAQDCPEELSIDVRDTPQIAAPDSRELKIAIRVSSGEGCGCAFPQLTLHLVQRLSVLHVDPFRHMWQWEADIWEMEVSNEAPPKKPGDACDFAAVPWRQ